MPTTFKTLGIVTALCALLLAACAGTGSQKSTGEYVDDAVVTTKVKTALIRSDNVDAVDVNVDTYKGVVQLSGFVDTRTEAEEAERLASRVAGVSRVENKLQYKSDQ